MFLLTEGGTLSFIAETTTASWVNKVFSHSNASMPLFSKDISQQDHSCQKNYSLMRERDLFSLDIVMHVVDHKLFSMHDATLKKAVSSGSLMRITF